MRGAARRLFALDENFPDPLVRGLRIAFDDVAELVSLRDIGDELLEVDDWEVLLRLHQHERRWDGLVTNDDAMLSLAREMTVFDQTGLTLVVIKGQGHNPIRATRLLLSHLHHICHQSVPHTEQIWRLSTSQKPPQSTDDFIGAIAARENLSVAELMTEISHFGLGAPPAMIGSHPDVPRGAGQQQRVAAAGASPRR